MGGIGNGTPDVIKGTDKDTDVAVVVGLDITTRSVNVNARVWDPSTLTWVRMEQPVLELSTGDLTITMGDVEALLADNYWKRMKPYLHTSTKPKYICKNTDIDANETDTDWYIWKYTDADIPQIEGPRTGACNTEGVVDALGWNI